MTRKRRYLISAAVLVACVGVALGVLAMMSADSGVSEANFDRIELGMTRGEVEAILGGPFEEMGNDAESSVVFGHPHHHSQALIGMKGGRVVQKTWASRDETFTDKLRRWLVMTPRGDRSDPNIRVDPPRSIMQ